MRVFVACAALVALAGCQSPGPEVAAETGPAVPKWAYERCGAIAKPFFEPQVDSPITDIMCDEEEDDIVFITEEGDLYRGGAFGIFTNAICIRAFPGVQETWDTCEPLIPASEPIG